MADVVFDAGAFIAHEKGQALVRQYVLLAAKGKLSLATSAAVLAQVWRGDPRRARIAKLLRGDVVEERSLDSIASRRIGALAASTHASDLVDGHVALLALDGDAAIVTSDPNDIVRWGVPPERIVRC